MSLIAKRLRLLRAPGACGKAVLELVDAILERHAMTVVESRDGNRRSCALRGTLSWRRGNLITMLLARATSARTNVRTDLSPSPAFSCNSLQSRFGLDAARFSLPQFVAA